MHSQLRRKIQAIALGSVLIVTQCCCCILPIRFQVDQNRPGVSASAPGFSVERVVCEIKEAARFGAAKVMPARWVEAQQETDQCGDGSLTVLKEAR